MEDPDQLTKLLFKGLSRGVINRETALLCVDLQRLDADPEGQLFQKARGLGLEVGLVAYRTRLSEVLERVTLLQTAFREKGLEVVHTRIQSLTLDGRDRSLLHRWLGIHAAPGSDDAEFVALVAPKGDEIVLNKTSASPFTSTPIDYVLRNVGISHLIVAGVMTSGCVETTARDAADRGYLVTLVTDACAARSPEMHEKTLRALGGLYVQPTTTAELLSELRGIRDASA